MTIGSGGNGELTFLDIVGLLSFFIGVLNLDANITQSDVQEQTQDLDERFTTATKSALAEIHDHLQDQDRKIDQILEVLRNENHQETVRDDRM